MEARPAVVRPVEGWAVAVVLQDAQGVLWWGPDERGVDVVAACGGRALVWASAEDCLQEVASRGWVVADSEPTVLDLRPLVAWLQGRRLALDAKAALDAWNFAADLAGGVGVRWSDRGRLADTCFDKLTTANVPWLAGLEQYRPRWTPRQHTYLRHRIAQAVSVICGQLLMGRAAPVAHLSQGTPLPARSVTRTVDGERVWRDLAAPRPLTQSERQLAQTLAAATGDTDLVHQVAHARVQGVCRCGCPSVQLTTSGPAVDPETVRRLSGSGRDDYFSVSAHRPRDGQSDVGVRLHVVAGLIEELEVFAGEGAVVPLPATSDLVDIHVS